MSTGENTTQLHMRRSLEALPELVVPDGYGLRAFQPDDITQWGLFLNENGELNEWNMERAAPYFAPGSRMPLDGSFFVTKSGEPVATAQLHLHPDGPYAPVPELGWVASSPAHRGRALGYIASLAVLRYAAAAGHKNVFLRTDDYRLPAIVTYLKLGFEPWPWMYDAGAAERWTHVLDALDRRRDAAAT